MEQAVPTIGTQPGPMQGSGKENSRGTTLAADLFEAGSRFIVLKSKEKDREERVLYGGAD